ncbi:curli production assembly/transport protein CsgE [Leeuwenhoekiella parthenopeia]|uniref:Curli production assembly/transport component CsgE n=1 Tax=Leeuwenhoekiella parthenopeia TaxID=2890320 RepID=A0ABS8GS59_9FLAO|nr:curli production assembly/transport protein CsgE [Leeuwenhoekiella parthenopeia]MCC4212817.1 curli production assembly/transport protein CsgE [Leeuwenhoekiella parthenopeia]
MFIFKGLISNKTPINTSIQYKFSIIYPQSGNDELEKEETEGRLVLDPNERLEVLSETIQGGEDLNTIILFLIYDTDGNLVGKDRKVIKNGVIAEDDTTVTVIQPNANADVAKSKEDGLVLRGIVVEDTKTKPGSDFYKEFYSNYLSKNINGEEIVTIKEVLALGRNTKMEVFVAEKKVFEFFIRPAAEYLKQMAQYSILQVMRQLEFNNKNQNTVQRY